MRLERVRADGWPPVVLKPHASDSVNTGSRLKPCFRLLFHSAVSPTQDLAAMQHALRASSAIFEIALLLTAGWAANGAQAESVNNLLINGDFSQTYQPVLSSNPLPESWLNLSGNTENAGVWNGALRFSTAGTHNATTHRYYVYQQFDAGAGGSFVLSFDYLLSNAYNGTAINGAKIAVDNWYVPAPEALFSRTYGSEGFGPAVWHLGETVRLNLAPGQHTLYLGTIGASQQNDQAYVAYDNVTLIAAVPEPTTAALLICGSLGLLGWRSRRQIGIGASDSPELREHQVRMQDS